MQDSTDGPQGHRRRQGGRLQKAISALRESGRGDLSTLINAMYLQNTMTKDTTALTGTFKGKAHAEARRAAAARRQRRRQRGRAAAISRMNAVTGRMRRRSASRTRT
jgi:hypothetical protein